MITPELVTIKKLHSVFVKATEYAAWESAWESTCHGGPAKRNQTLALTFNAEMMRLGFVMSKELFNEISYLDKAAITNLYGKVIPILKSMKGDDVKYKPMYPNFPDQVMEMSHLELYLNAIMHYWSFGEWKPDYDELPRGIALEDSKFVTLDLCEDENESVFGLLNTLFSSNSSLSQEDRDIVEWSFDYYNTTELFSGAVPSEIPFKETMCIVAANLLQQKLSPQKFVKTSTDVLRLMTHLSDGDVSLSENTKFKSFPNKQRRLFLQLIENNINEDDIARHKNKWVKAFHILHVGDYKNKYPKTFAIAQKIRNKITLNTFASRVERALANGDTKVLPDLLGSRPGEFARRLDHVLRISKKNKPVVEAFSAVMPKVSTRVLLQLGAHINARADEDNVRVAFPKGNAQSAMLLPALPPLKPKAISTLQKNIDETLIERFSELEPLGDVWIDPKLKECPVPIQQRSASTGLFSVARGTRLPISDKNTLRFFIYWVGKDLDLSATLHDEELNIVENISYTNLKSTCYQSCHSGDIVNAPNGAAEFIDITMDGALKAGIRYVVMNVLVYNGPNFSEHKKCYAGWMTKDQPNSGDVFDPKLVEQKIDLTSEAKNAFPVVFDLKARQGIWCDLITGRNAFANTFIPNNVENNRASIQDSLKAMLSLSNKPSLYNLFELHAKARGTLIDNRVLRTKVSSDGSGDDWEDNADTVFSLNEGITPFDVNKISSEFL